MTAAQALSREEEAYAHLCSFTAGESAVIGARGHDARHGVVLCPQAERLSGGMGDAYMVVLAGTLRAFIAVSDMLGGFFHVEHAGNGWDGSVTWFDEAGYKPEKAGAQQ